MLIFYYLAIPLGKVHLLCQGGGGMKMLRGGTEIFSGNKGGGSEISRYTKGGGGH